ACHPMTVIVLEEHVERAVEDEEHLLDLMRVRGIALPGLDIHDGQGETARRDDRRIGMLARAAGADETVLSPPVTVDLCVLEGRPVRHEVGEATDVSLRHCLGSHAGGLRIAGMAGCGHGLSLHWTVTWRWYRRWAPRRSRSNLRPASPDASRSADPPSPRG